MTRANRAAMTFALGMWMLVFGATSLPNLWRSRRLLSEPDYEALFKVVP